MCEFWEECRGFFQPSRWKQGRRTAEHCSSALKIQATPSERWCLPPPPARSAKGEAAKRGTQGLSFRTRTYPKPQAPSPQGYPQGKHRWRWALRKCAAHGLNQCPVRNRKQPPAHRRRHRHMPSAAEHRCRASLNCGLCSVRHRRSS